MARLIIIGGFAGAGKSTLARRAGTALSIPVYEIDALALMIIRKRTGHPNQNEFAVDHAIEHKWKWYYLAENEFPDAIRIDATQLADEVYHEVMYYLTDFSL